MALTCIYLEPIDFNLIDIDDDCPVTPYIAPDAIRENWYPFKG